MEPPSHRAPPPKTYSDRRRRRTMTVVRLKARSAQVAGSGTTCKSRLFDLCVLFLVLLANALDPVWPGGMDYVKINVILFCVILPIILVGSLGLNIYLLCR